jgi:alkanesulfonate monooxygenase SsuD/methylene tetrahydromethanopterin reductase-like flavin-dependent oxidoreductase (luciferase family)
MRRPLVDVYHDTLVEIAASEELGYESAWLSEHHFCDDNYLPAVMPMLGAIAVRTSKIRIGSYLALAPLYHPIRLAEDSAVVDILSNGRLELGIGSGYVRDDFVGLGVDFAGRGRMTDETVAILLQAWSDEKVNFTGSIHSFEEVSVTPKPIQQPVPIYLGGVSRPVLERVARLGLTGVAGFPLAEDSDFFREQLRKYGRDAQAIDYLGYVHLWVDRDHERERRIASPI